MSSCSLAFTDFVVWTEAAMHVERIERINTFFEEKVKLAHHFFKFGVLPELIGKFYSQPQLQTLDTGLKTDAEESNSDVWCYCRQNIDSMLTACDYESCKIQWFHFKCVGIKATPKGKWYCPECRKMGKCEKGASKDLP